MHKLEEDERRLLEEKVIFLNIQTINKIKPSPLSLKINRKLEFNNTRQSDNKI
jgi:hypothetical protein